MRNQLIIIILCCLLRPLSAQVTNISNGEVFDGEPFMIINSNNTSHIIVAWMGYNGLDLISIKTRVSMNGGLSWSTPNAIPHISPAYTSADPSMAFDSDGNLLLSYIDYHPAGTSGKAIIRKSIDGGYTWGEAVEVIDAFADGFEIPIDRPWMVIDTSGTATDGNIYITTKPAPWIPFPNRNYLSVSTNNGASFNEWRYIDTIGAQIGDFIAAPMATPAVAIDGAFYCIYPAWEISENLLPRFILAKSANGGNTFTYSEVFESFGADLNNDTSAKAAYLLLTSPINADHLMFTYVLKSFGDLDIFFMETFNQGVTWSAAVRVNDDPIGTDVMQDLLWADFDTDGDLAIAWRDRRNAIDTGYAAATQIYCAVKWKDDETFSPNFNISGPSADFDDVLYGNGNDFMCVAMENDTIYATWGDTRDTYLNIWFNKQAADNTGGTAIQLIASESKNNIALYPNPANEHLFSNVAGGSSYIIFDYTGKRVAFGLLPLETPASINIDMLPAGNYLIEFNTLGKKHAASFVKE